GATDLYVQANTWDPATCDGCIPSTGWHTHPGPSFVIVTQGSVTVYNSDDPACTPHVYTAGTPNNAVVDPGGGHVHIIRDESGAVAKTVAVQFIPAGAARRQDAPDPDNCPFGASTGHASDHARTRSAPAASLAGHTVRFVGALVSQGAQIVSIRHTAAHSPGPSSPRSADPITPPARVGATMC